MTYSSLPIFLAADHAGYDLKGELVKFFDTLGYFFVDLGTYSKDPVDYPDVANTLVQKVIENPETLGIAICGTGIGISIACNRHKGIRAAVVTSPEMACFARAHNNANILCLGARLIDLQTAQECAKVFLQTPFQEGRHVKRIQKLEGL